MAVERIAAYAEENGWEPLCAAPLSAYTSFKVGGPADLLVTVPDAAAAAKLLAVCRSEGVPSLLFGNGSNLLVGDQGVRGVVWRFSPAAAACRLLSDDGKIVCGAGLPLGRLCRFAKEHALTGLEFVFGIPGSAGGAAFMNAGAYGGQMADVLESATVLLPDGTQREMPAAEMALGYRHSALMDTGAAVTALTLRLSPGSAAAIDAQMQAFLSRRREKQPLEYPSAGSFFKRPAGHFAGALIEQCGLKGFSVGGAAVSEKHAGFIVNTGGASAADIRTLAAEVIRRVAEETGVTLTPEVRFVGDF